VLASCLLGPVSGYAGTTTTPPLSVRALASRADVVVIGEVLLVRSEWDPAWRVISTRVDLRVGEALKGEVTGDGLQFRQPGGRAGGVVAVVGGAPSFTSGERVLLVLSRRPDGKLVVAGLFEGKFSLERDTVSGREMAVRRVPESDMVLDRIPLDQARIEVLTAPDR
jgi:hypothetical protein